MSRIRTDIENLLLHEMVEEDNAMIMAEDTIDDIIPTNTDSLFGDCSSDDLDDILDGDYDDALF